MRKLIAALLACSLGVSISLAQQAQTKTEEKKATTQTTSQVKPVRKVVKLESLPTATQDAIKKAIGAGKLIELVSITEGDKTTYEAQVETGKQKSTMKFDASGKTIQ